MMGPDERRIWSDAYVRTIGLGWRRSTRIQVADEAVMDFQKARSFERARSAGLQANDPVQGESSLRIPEVPVHCQSQTGRDSLCDLPRASSDSYIEGHCKSGSPEAVVLDEAKLCRRRANRW